MFSFEKQTEYANYVANVSKFQTFCSKHDVSEDEKVLLDFFYKVRGEIASLIKSSANCRQYIYWCNSECYVKFLICAKEIISKYENDYSAK